MAHDTKAVPQRSGQHAWTGRCTYKRKMRKIDTQRPCRRSFSDHDVDRIIFHRRIEYFLYLPVQTVDLINKKDISFLKIVQYGGHFSGFLYGRPAGYFEVCAEFIGNNAGKGCLTQPRRSVKKDMVQGIAPELCRFDINLQILLSLFLAYVFVQ